MSSCPGTTLEDYLAWCYNLVVENQSEANVSLGIAEMFGNVTPRPRLTQEQFGTIVTLFEPYRERVEELLMDFDEDNDSWRTYAGCCFDFLPDDLDDEVEVIIKRN